jgi:hypothetical protein
MESTYTTVERQAYDLGKQHAINAASWIIDGNTPTEHIARMVQWLDDGDPQADDYLPRRPDLSGEWADEATPRDLAQDILGEDAPDAAILEGLCDAYEAGVSENFEAECERILRAAL